MPFLPQKGEGDRYRLLALREYTGWATRIIGLEIAGAGVLIQLLCLWNSLNPFDHSHDLLVNVGFLIGTAAVVVGCAVYAKGKGRSPAWGILGVFSVVGFYVLSLLNDKPASLNDTPAARPPQKAQ